MAADFDAYVRALARTHREEDGTEHTDRSALERLLKAAADDAKPGARITHEPRRDKAGAGSPDFKVTREGRIAGYVEVKQIDENLSKVLKSDQIKKYRTLTDNLVLTDYLEFVWIRPDGEVVRERLAYSEDLSAHKPVLKPERVTAVGALLRGFFSAAPARIGKGRTLALALAKRAAMLRDFLSEELQRQVKEHREGRLLALHDAFKKQVFQDLGVGEFADAFAQMLSYGLFLARLNAGETETVRLDNVRQHIPGSFALIRELVRFLDEMNEPEYRDIRWVIEELLSIVNGVDLAAIHGDLSFRARKAVSGKVKAEDEEESRLFERDPFIYFYEDFLKAYDPAMRKSRGVYYTPPPVVNFIIRAIDDILKDSFGIERGLADHEKVTVLDFACGTGTFLLEAFEKVFETIGGADAGQADQIVREHLTKNLYGFEYLIAPYTIAHLKLSQYLKDKGHPLKDGERLQVFLTNTLEPVEPQRDLMLPELSREVEAAQAVKEKPILVITGNPPYAAASRNRGLWITTAIEAYKYIDGIHFGEKKHWLHDDYVKFIRFAQLKLDEVDRGVVGLITNHSWLDNPTFRAMRVSLMRTFDRIEVIDLHGNSKKQEKSPDGGPDENVFDIEQGVAIAILVKDGSSNKRVLRDDIWGKRQQKYKILKDINLLSSSSTIVYPSKPDFLFKKQDAERNKEYMELHSLSEIFLSRTAGVITARDDFAISYSKSEALKKVRQFLSIDGFDGSSKIDIPIDTRGWAREKARKLISEGDDWQKQIDPIIQSPFDTRVFLNDPRLIDWGRWSYYKRISPPYIGLVLARKIDVQGDWCHVVAVDERISHHALSIKEVNYFTPIYIENRENFSPDFRGALDGRYDHHYTPEEIIGYIYAVLHAPTYRRRYNEFLRIDFPRIPFPETKAQFDALSELGWALVQAHLLKAVPKPAARLGVYHGQGDDTVEAVRYAPDEQAIWINKAKRFEPVPQAVWDFHIGGYQVLNKYLKSRRGRTLSLGETTHVGKVAETLAFTIAQMARIDEAYQEAFPAVDNSEAPLASAS